MSFHFYPHLPSGFLLSPTSGIILTENILGFVFDRSQNMATGSFHSGMCFSLQCDKTGPPIQTGAPIPHPLNLGQSGDSL